MASIITATTSSGLTQSADNSGVLQLASGTGNLVTVPSVTGTAMVSGNMPAFFAYKNDGDQSITTATFTKVTFSAEEYDTNSNFASSRFTPTVAGYYQTSAVITNANGTTPTRQIVMLYKNGSAYAPFVDSLNSSTYRNGGSCLVYLNGSSDYIEIYAYLSGSAGMTLQSGSSTGVGLNTYFSGVLVRAA